MPHEAQCRSTRGEFSIDDWRREQGDCQQQSVVFRPISRAEAIE
jgi:hypothetical protein